MRHPLSNERPETYWATREAEQLNKMADEISRIVDEAFPVRAVEMEVAAE